MSMQSLSDFFSRHCIDEAARIDLLKRIAPRIHLVMAYDVTADGLLSLRDGGGEWFDADAIAPPSDALRLIVVRQLDNVELPEDSPYALLEKVIGNLRKAVIGICAPDWDGLLGCAFITDGFADEWMRVAPEKVGSGSTAAEYPDIPGKLPRIAIGRLAVTAAWQIECKSGQAATADKVIEQLQAWATAGEHPDILRRAEPKMRAVIWMIKKTGLEKDYDVGACGKALDVWRKSRV
jgi:hypothetical protein